MENNYQAFLKTDDSYEPVGEMITTLPSGFYTPYCNPYNGKYYLRAKNVIQPKLYTFHNGVQETILNDIYKFWDSEEIYRRFGSVYKRNILLYSVPGNGKTSLINIITNKLISEYNGIVIFIDSADQLRWYSTVMGRFRQIEPNRKVVTVVEDFEEMANNSSLITLLLQTLDGNSQFDNVVTIATTNYPEQLDKRFTSRPSRFNLVVEYKKPDADIRREYITMKLSEGGVDVNDPKTARDIEKYVALTENYTFDFLKEFIQGIYIDGLNENTVNTRLRKLISEGGNVKVTDDSDKKIGFTCNEFSVDSVLEHAESPAQLRGDRNDKVTIKPL